MDSKPRDLKKNVASVNITSGYGVVQRMNPRHFKILECILRGMTDKQIGEKLEMVARSIGLIRNSPQFQHELAMRKVKIDELVNINIANEVDEVAKALKEAGLRAAQKLIGCLDSGDANILLKASSDILDRAGYPKVTKTNATVALATISIDKEIGDRIIETFNMDKDS